MSIAMRPLVERIVQAYALPLDGCHGIAHWARVHDIGFRLAEATDADPDVVRLFAVFHDACRESEGHDPQHGPRGAQLAAELRGEFFELTDRQFTLLREACQGHTDQRHHADVTVQTCWDSDRLDLGRVGVYPNRYFLNTKVAMQEETIRWAHSRAAFLMIPDWLHEQWGVQLPLAARD